MAAPKTAAELWAALEALPENVKGEIIDGELFVQPRLWVVEPAARTLEVRELRDGAWVVRSVHGDESALRIPPFEEAEIPLVRMWIAEEATER
jgi:hypothetical protein